MRKLSLLFVPLLMFISSCSTHTSHRHGHGYGYGHHNRIIGALIVGDIIGHIIHESRIQRRERLERESQLDSSNSEENEPQTDPSAEVRASNQGHYRGINPEASKSAVEWYQLGKDGNCYIMSVYQGVTDIVSAVPDNKCDS